MSADQRPSFRRLAYVVPRQGFNWRGQRHILARMDLDIRVQDAMRLHGGADFRFDRRTVTSMLCDMLNGMAEALRISDAGSMTTEFGLDFRSYNDPELEIMSAITLVQAQFDWFGELSLEVAFHLIHEVIKARESYVVEHPDDNGGVLVEYTYATLLHDAVAELVNLLGERYAEDHLANALADKAGGMLLAGAEEEDDMDEDEDDDVYEDGEGFEDDDDDDEEKIAEEGRDETGAGGQFMEAAEEDVDMDME